MKGKILLAALLVFAIALSGCIQQPAACTEEAKACPDGTTVGRNPALNCEFDPCPSPECKGEGETIPVIASPPSCCPSLELIPPREENWLGIAGYCTAKCGNGTCDEETESSYNCPLDCMGGGPLYSCGDRICQDWEVVETDPGYCPEDCMGGGPLYSCGDRICQDWEVVETDPGYCPDDCPAP